MSIDVYDIVLKAIEAYHEQYKAELYTSPEIEGIASQITPEEVKATVKEMTK